MGETANGQTVVRSKRVEVQRCQSRTTKRWYSPEDHQCPYAAVVNLDGEWLCQLHADKWVRGEGEAFRELEQTHEEQS